MRYKTIMFDCDGVLLDSNKVKTKGFYEVAKQYGHDFANKLVEYHVQNGGISRYKKFEYLCKDILHEQNYTQTVNRLSDEYGEYVFDKLLTCEITKNLSSLRDLTSATWMIISGGAQEELREVFERRGISISFNGGIYGNPRSKEEIIQDLEITEDAVFLGDSRYDHVASSKFDIDFRFIYGWTEMKDWQEYCNTHSISSYKTASEAIKRMI